MNATDQTPPVMPGEPATGEPGYIHGYLDLHNGGRLAVTRDPNGTWCWMPLTLEADRKRGGTWADLLDHVGRGLPVTWRRLVEHVEGTDGQDHDWYHDGHPAGRLCRTCRMREKRDNLQGTLCIGTSKPYEAGHADGVSAGRHGMRDHVIRRLFED